MIKNKIQTENAPKAIGPYSQAIQSNNTVYLSGQIPLDPKTMTMVSGDIRLEAQQVMKNLAAVCEASGGSLSHIVKFTVFLTDLNHFAMVNDVMSEFMKEPYPARTTIQVAALPKGAQVEIDAIMVI